MFGGVLRSRLQTRGQAAMGKALLLIKQRVETAAGTESSLR